MKKNKNIRAYMIDFAYVVIVKLIKMPVCGTTCPDRVKEEHDVFKKETTNNSLLTAIDNGSLDNILGGGKLLSERDVTSESDK